MMERSQGRKKRKKKDRKEGDERELGQKKSGEKERSYQASFGNLRLILLEESGERGEEDSSLIKL